MAHLHELPDGASMAYDDAGSGRPVVLIHGVSMSRRFFERNVATFAERFHVINVDLRGHGESPPHDGGHTVAQYARDIRHLLRGLELDAAVLVGWSMGSLVVWDMIRQFGTGGLAGHVVVSQGRQTSRRRAGSWVPSAWRSCTRRSRPHRRTTAA
jgi:non-heme chloroperoxidase